MKKKRTTFILVAVFLFFALSAKIYGEANVISINEMRNPNDGENKIKIGENVISSMGLNDNYKYEEIMSVDVYYGDIYGDEALESIVAVKLGPNNTLVAVYNITENGYKYLGDVGEFFEIKNVEFFPVDSIDKNIIFLTEHADQHIGAYERNVFYRGYMWEDDSFKMVLNIDKEVKAIWNELREQESDTSKSKWNKIEQKSDINFSNGKNAVVNVIQRQSYSISSNKNTKNIQKDNTFSEIKNNTVKQKYHWNDEWKSFILSEKNDKKTGHKVAVIEDFSLSPYVLLGEQFDKYRILRKDGTTDVVDKDSLSNIRERRSEPVFMVY